MAKLYIPESVELHKFSTDSENERQDTRVSSDMDFGTHNRKRGDATIKKVECVLILPRNEFFTFMNWLDVAEAKIFYSTFPDVNYPFIERGKYYAFSFESINVSEKREGKHKYSVELSLYWHFRVAGGDKE